MSAKELPAAKYDQIIEAMKNIIDPEIGFIYRDWETDRKSVV